MITDKRRQILTAKKAFLTIMQEEQKGILVNLMNQLNEFVRQKQIYEFELFNLRNEAQNKFNVTNITDILNIIDSDIVLNISDRKFKIAGLEAVEKQIKYNMNKSEKTIEYNSAILNEIDEEILSENQEIKNEGQ